MSKVGMRDVLVDRLHSALAVALGKNLPLAAVPVGDLSAGIVRLNADAALFRDLDEWVKSPEVKGLEVSGAIRGYKVSEEFADKAGEMWRRVAEEAK